MNAAASHTLPAAGAGELRLDGETPVRRIGYGAMQLPGLPVAWGPPRDHDAALDVLRRARELGIQLIDTAPFYGPEVADRLIAEALHPYPEDLVISTKVGVRRGADRSWVPDAAPASLREQVEASLRRLRAEALGLVHLRLADAVVLSDSSVPLADSFGALAELRERGLVRHLGLSSATDVQLAEARAIAPVAAVQNPFNLGRSLRRAPTRGVRAQRDRLHPVLPAWSRRADPLGGPDGDRWAPRGERRSGGARVATAALRGDALDPRHGARGAP